MINISEIFVQNKVEFYGADTSVILFCGDLKYHVNDQIQKILGDAKVLLYFLPKNMTEVVQPIDAGYGRSLRCKIEHSLDIWLMSE